MFFILSLLQFLLNIYLILGMFFLFLLTDKQINTYENEELLNNFD